ncbi:MAG: 1,3-beta-galactosyl-N-acetylhexosamine phosphorylase [Dermabacter sp.]|nr:1,3-beta-galactosyl-N-acetylhexosamine phosphorylase [Dermabacter sp.]
MPETTAGRLTLPIQRGMDDAVRALIARLGADAVRDSDGTELPALVHDLAVKVYAKYFVGRGDNAWADAHPDDLTRIYLMSERTLAPADGPLTIPLMDRWFADQVRPDTDCDVERWWQVIDRTTGEVADPERWSVEGDAVLLTSAEASHVYTVNFLAVQTWDPTQMYNYLTNGWADEAGREKEKPFDVRHEDTWAYVQESLGTWLTEHPEVDVVRFTTFFYHFTLVYGADAKERFVDWFGYSASVSVAAMEAFEHDYGYPLSAEDFVDEGYYNSPFRPPSPVFRDWIEFQHQFVTAKVKDLVDQVHAAGKEAIMFLGDNWIGVEPYGPHFARTGLDAVVGSVGSGATCRMIADIPHVRYTEGRFLPYFFPDVFTEGGDPAGEATASWLPARRAIVRSPLDRIGYGGYLSLALDHPDFVDRVEEIVAEFRAIHDNSLGARPATAPVTIGVLNAWGRLRSWQTHMVAHAIEYRQTASYIGVLEALAGLPFDVEFLSFEDVEGGVPAHIGVLINAGSAGTAFSGGEAWNSPRLIASINAFVTRGGGIIGVGEPSAFPGGGRTFRLADLFGVDQELGWGLSTAPPAAAVEEHFITADSGPHLETGDGARHIILTSPNTTVLGTDAAGHVAAAAHEVGEGRAVYLAGLPYSANNARLLHRACAWAAGLEDDFGQWSASDVRVDIAHYPEAERFLAINNSLDPLTTEVRGSHGATWSLTLTPGGHAWVSTTTASGTGPEGD